ncbi:cytochrome b/b6 domain-containing protein [Brumimicrobium oceani]|uniref:Cytochrome B n=1 Tax=Brumimicrobium oceani TaxID=2100725 RepID=A0A2U2XDE9_9FLAO|nr:cytochrome b/b6 domain-containing protein [Brumimicrobium oceani]PWH85741.1 cytochrome B [Brumimicrobium oceani]
MKTKFTPLHRFLHWTIAVAMTVLYGTGFLRMYWLNKHKMVDIIASKTQALPKEEMTEIAKAIRAPMWEWHVSFAYVMVFAFLVRIIYMIAKGIKFPSLFNSKLPMKERLQGSIYLFFYVFVFVSMFTGVSLKQGFFPEMKDSIETVHKLGIYWFPIFILLHIAGILIAEYTNKKGISSEMISGKESDLK